jgi:hypothetical protein
MSNGHAINEWIVMDYERPVTGSSYVELDAGHSEANRLTKGP